jgi:hypothetical protein
MATSASNAPVWRKRAVEIRIEFQDVERPPEIAVADRRRCAEREDDDVV